MLFKSDAKANSVSNCECRQLGCMRLAFALSLLVGSLISEAAETKSQKEAHTVTNSIGMKFVSVPAGTFLMGSPETEVGSRVDERPVHEVEISRPFLLGTYEVTQAEYQKVVGANPSYFCKDGAGAKKVEGLVTDRFPVEQVSWVEADEYCKKLSAMPEEVAAHRTYRLPTEAEWQYACRAGKSNPIPFWHGTRFRLREY